MDILKQTSYTFSKTNISLLLRIDNFPAFVTSQEKYRTRDISFNNTRWYISIRFERYCQTAKKSMLITPGSDQQAETLAAYVHGKTQNKDKDCSFDVTAKFKCEQLPFYVIHECEFTRKFSFNSSNRYENALGFPAMAKIDVFELIFSQSNMIS